jgi:hypothetical protein
MKRDTHAILSTIAIVGLAGLFLLVCAFLALSAGQVFQRIDSDSAGHDTARILRGYLTNQIRRHDTQGSISIRPFGDGDALYLSEGAYATVVYCYEGNLMELFADAEYQPEPQFGDVVAPAATLHLSSESGLTAAITTIEGEVFEIFLPVRTGVVQ